MPTSAPGADPAEYARGVLRAEAAAIEQLCARIDGDFSEAVERILACSGRVVVTGMGKPGFIAQKISATFASTGTPSLFLHPAEALHPAAANALLKTLEEPPPHTLIVMVSDQPARRRP